MPEPIPTIPAALESTLEAILAVPVVPLHEAWLIRAIRHRVAGWPDVECIQDRFGNLLLRYRPSGDAKPKLCLQAHLDHPGFVLERLDRDGSGLAETLGGMARNLKGARLRFFQGPDDPGAVAEILRSRRARGTRRVTLRFDREKRPVGSIGMLDLPAWRRSGSFVEGRGFDDNLGTALLIYVLEESRRQKLAVPFDVLLTRAEEVGLVGATSLARAGELPLAKIILTVEMPRAQGDLRAGGGVIVRTGDWAFNYDGDLLLWLQSLAGRLAAKDDSFRFQRRLGWTGITESTPFLLHGHRAANLCLPGIWAHNIGPGARPAPERVHGADLMSMVALLEAVLREPIRPGASRRRLKRYLAERAANRAHQLEASVE